jgi:hypothetical protein
MNIPSSTLSLTWLPLMEKTTFCNLFRQLNVSFVTILDAFELTHCICGQPLDLVGTHFFYCSCGGKRTTFHYVIWDAFTSIMKDTRFHVV